MLLSYISNIIYNIFYNNVDEIIPGVWLGNYKSAIDLNFLKSNNINFIVNCTKDKPFYTEVYNNIVSNNSKTLIDTYRIPVNDSLLECDIIIMEKYFRIIIPLLMKKYIKGERILIHCHAGKQRSAIVVAALLKSLLDRGYIILDIPESKDKTDQFYNICDYISKKRSQVFTHGLRINFDRSYKRFYEII